MLYDFKNDTDSELDSKLAQAYKRLYACSMMNNQLVIASMNSYIEAITLEIGNRQNKKKKVDEKPALQSHEYSPPQSNKKKLMSAKQVSTPDAILDMTKVEVRQKFNFKFTTKPEIEKEE